jgi:hypothetical protein
VAHAYNPSFSGNKDQEDHSSKPTPQQIVRLYHKKKKNWVTDSIIGPTFEMGLEGS